MLVCRTTLPVPASHQSLQDPAGIPANRGTPRPLNPSNSWPHYKIMFLPPLMPRMLTVVVVRGAYESHYIGWGLAYESHADLVVSRVLMSHMPTLWVSRVLYMSHMLSWWENDCQRITCWPMLSSLPRFEHGWPQDNLFEHCTYQQVHQAADLRTLIGQRYRKRRVRGDAECGPACVHSGQVLYGGTSPASLFTSLL